MIGDAALCFPSPETGDDGYSALCILATLLTISNPLLMDRPSDEIQRLVQPSPSWSQQMIKPNP